MGISAAEFTQRKENTLESMKTAGLDALVAVSSYQEREGNVCYLCGYHNSFPNGMSHSGLGHAAYVLCADGFASLVVPSGASPVGLCNVDKVRDEKDLVNGIAAALQEKGLRESRVGIAGMDVLPAEYYLRLQKDLPGAALAAANEIIETQRLIKSPAEIEILREAARIAGVGLKAGLGAVKAGATRQDVELAARQAAMAAGADFIPRVRVSSGRKVDPLTWPLAGRQVLEEGDFVFLDLIGWYAGYGWDCSRVAVVGKPTAGQQDYLDHMREATDWMVSRLVPGRQMEFVFTESRSRVIIPMAHGIGLEICENPWITMNQYFTLQPGMVLCVEPSVITPEFGQMCIEDTVVVTRSGVEVITNFGF